VLTPWWDFMGIYATGTAQRKALVAESFYLRARELLELLNRPVNAQSVSPRAHPVLLGGVPGGG
jgi:hypothetical protein